MDLAEADSKHDCAQIWERRTGSNGRVSGGNWRLGRTINRHDCDQFLEREDRMQGRE